jgi:tRNA G37 N-methylase Trm5
MEDYSQFFSEHNNDGVANNCNSTDDNDSDDVRGITEDDAVVIDDDTSNEDVRLVRQIRHNFRNAKAQCLGKRDKSSAGRVDPGAVEICAVLNALDGYYTTSSCAGRCFLYVGQGVKATDTFRRTRVCHDPIADPQRYFDLRTLVGNNDNGDRAIDPTGGGDPVKEFDGGRLRARQNRMKNGVDDASMERQQGSTDHEQDNESTGDTEESVSPFHNTTIWLRFEPFILHVACQSLSAAGALMNTARGTFKNVGLTAFNGKERYLVAIWGDEGMDMPITDERGTAISHFAPSWLAQLVNERHARNTAKIQQLVQSIRAATELLSSCDPSNTMPRHYDVIGDVALLHSVSTTDPSQLQQMGQTILDKNKAIKIVALRNSNLTGPERAAGTLQILAGPTNRSPLITTHREYGVACIVDLQATFFTPRMGPERLRICQQTARGERVLVLFAGVALEALQLAARTEAASVTAIEQNRTAVACARRSHQLLERNRKGVRCPGAAERLTILEGDCLELLPTLERNYYNRVLAPRPKEGSLDGDQPGETNDTAGGGDFFVALLPVLKRDGGECHWYDFCADHEFPSCKRTCDFLARHCREQQLKMEVLHVANAGSVAKRQLRVCVDFRVSPAE